MRIGYLVSEYPHIRHAYLLREIRGLRKLGWEPDVIALRPDRRPQAQYTREESEEFASTTYILRLGGARIVWAHLHTLLTCAPGYASGLASALRYGRFHPRRTVYGLFYFAEAVAAGWLVRRRKLKHLHTHYASTLAWMMARVFGIPVSMTIHGSGEFDDPEGFRLREKVEISKFVCAISYFGRSQIMRATSGEQWSKIEICRLGVDPAEFAPRPFRPEPRPFELLCVGGMARPRAFHVVVGALAQLRGEGRDAILRLVGDGPDRPALERLARELGAADRVVFEGWKNHAQLRSIYQSADVFVFSSFAEGIPVVLMEAMAMEIPCVASRITGIPELIRDGVDGLLTAASDEREMARAIARLMDDAPFRRRLGQAARAHIVEEYNLPRNIQALAGIFRRRLEGE